MPGYKAGESGWRPVAGVPLQDIFHFLAWVKLSRTMITLLLFSVKTMQIHLALRR